ncbi:MAG: Cof-type HAD-IIB family hydrolase [Romboutsia sp.]|uniref:Cof-type HAD-IIB family hydrolase n=1 Tax=Romboutsia sp. TaxID=1965302 RepID=UPI003F2D1D2F
MKKLLASDVDGTLCVDNKIHDKNVEYIKKFREDGHAFLLCTGRNFSGVRYLVEEYDIEADGYVLCNGSVVLDKNLNVIYSKEIEYKTIKEAFEGLKNKDEYNFYFADGEHLYIIDGYFNNPILKVDGMEKKWNVIRISEDEFYKNRYSANIIGIEVINKSIEKTEEKIKEIDSKLGEEVTVYRNQYFIDIVPKGISKAEGISKVLDTYGVKEDDVFVIGDSWNDLSMFKKYNKNSYTFSYAEDELKPHASNIVDAFHHCLERIIK